MRSDAVVTCIFDVAMLEIPTAKTLLMQGSNIRVLCQMDGKKQGGGHERFTLFVD
jgi:hypothetical protein